MVLNLVWVWYVLFPVSCPYHPQRREVGLGMRRACRQTAGIDVSKWLLYLRVITHVVHVIVDVCFVYMLITWNYDHFCRNVFGGVVLYCLQGHWVLVCTSALLSPLVSGSLKWYSQCVCYGIPGIHIHSYGLYLLMIFMNNGAYQAHLWHFRHLKYQCYCNLWSPDYVFVNFSFFSFFGTVFYGSSPMCEHGGGTLAVLFTTNMYGLASSPSSDRKHKHCMEATGVLWLTKGTP